MPSLKNIVSCRSAAAALTIVLLLPHLNGASAEARKGLPPHAEAGVLVKDYSPRSLLKVESHLVERARFPVIDVHTHVDRDDPERLIRVMDACNVARVVNFNGGFGPHLKESIQRFSGHPGRVIPFARIDWSRIDAPDFAREAARQLGEDVAAGARGLKIAKELGLVIREKSGRLIAVNDPRLDLVWTKAGELGIPVAMHISDPDAFFEPIDRYNERYRQLLEFPQWSYYGRDVPSKPTLLSQRNDVIERHPGTVFIGLHVGDASENLAEAAAWLRRYPNLHLEIAARLNELGRQPYTARRFLIEHADRVMMGTDRIQPTEDLYRAYFRFLETEDEYFETPPGGNLWRIYGVHLPDDVLRKIYHENAERLLHIG